MKRISDEELDKLLREKLVFDTYPMSAEIINALEELKARRDLELEEAVRQIQDSRMCQSRYNRGLGHITRCSLPRGHEGAHTDGVGMWLKA